MLRAEAEWHGQSAWRFLSEPVGSAVEHCDPAHSCPLNNAPLPVSDAAVVVVQTCTYTVCGTSIAVAAPQARSVS